MNYLLTLLFAFFPGIVWLLFYLRKDVHPEPKLLVLRVFFLGMAVGILAIFIELGLYKILNKFLETETLLFLILNTFLGVALVEEYLKFLVVEKAVLKNPEFDEPIDAVIYMIISGLGFATLENILLFWKNPETTHFPYLLSFVRFISATLLHALTSGILGYFLAKSFFQIKERKKLIIKGLVSVSLLHGIYNFSIIKGEGFEKIFIPAFLLCLSAAFLSFEIKRLKKMISVCKIK